MNGQIEIEALSQQVPNGVPLKLPLALNTGIMLPRPGRYSISISAGSSKAQLAFNAVLFETRLVWWLPTPKLASRNLTMPWWRNFPVRVA
jgi:hypothetical protein